MKTAKAEERTVTKARCTACDWIVATSPTGTALSHGWIDFGKCPGSGQPTENPNYRMC